LETWFVDCKRYTRGVPPEKLQGLLAWAQAERPDVALFIASGFLSNPAKDYLHQYDLNNRPPFRIKYWERPTLERLATAHEPLIRRYLFDVPRNESEIVEAEQEFFDKVWLRPKRRSLRKDRGPSRRAKHTCGCVNVSRNNTALTR
jgi:hypothetical protein